MLTGILLTAYGLLQIEPSCYDTIQFEKSQRKTTIYNKTTSEDSDQPVHPRNLVSVFADRMYLQQPPGYLKKDKQDLLLYMLIWIFAGHKVLWQAFVVRWL